MACMLTHSLHSPIVCGGIGVITPTVGAAIPTMAGDGTAGTVPVGASDGEAGMQVAGGDTITIIIIILIITVVTGVAVTGEAVIGRITLIRTDALTVQTVPHT